MSTATKHVLKIFVSHQDLNKFPNIRDACRILDEEKNRINNEGRQKDLIEVRIVDYQYWRNLANPSNSTYQSANSLKDDASNAHAVFTLVDGDISPRIRKWYNVQIRRVRKEKEERRIHMPIFWDTSTSVSADNCEAFYQKNDSDFVFRYNSMDELRGLLASELKQLTDRWATTISRQQTVPTLASNLLRRRIKWLISGIVFAALCLSVYMLWPRIKDLCSRDAINTPVETVDESQVNSSLSDESIASPEITPPHSNGQNLANRGEDTPGESKKPGESSKASAATIRVDNSAYIDVKALTFTGDYNAQLISSIESCLLAKGFSIARDKKSAHYNVWVEAKPTDATAAHIIHLEVSTRITNLKTGKIIYSDTKPHKDGAGSDDAAALKIYRRISKTIGEEISNNIH